ncbi:MAG: argininosuccinate lyase, partial [Bacteroidia bacterium]
TNTAQKIEDFTVGKDKEFDLILAPYDVQGSLAHAKQLHQIGLLTAAEWQLIEQELQLISTQINKGEFILRDDVEDVHSQIEFMLTEKLGEVGKKIHTGRSRNDQILVDIKLYLRDVCKQLSKQTKSLIEQLLELSETHQQHLLPGYTHFQLAMPSSFGLWFGAYAESLVDDLELMQAAYHINNKNPLGSGAGYGSSFPLNRTLTTELLGFEHLNVNVVYAQMTRGKSEKVVAIGMSALAATLSKFAYDVCLCMNQNFGFISFPDELTTGSSIMPHKKNPDVFELIRAKCNRIQALPNELTLLTNNLPSGYHRDMQLTKEILFPAIEELKSCIDMTGFMLQHINIKPNLLTDEKYAHLFSVERVNELVLKGTAFRDA